MAEVRELLTGSALGASAGLLGTGTRDLPPSPDLSTSAPSTSTPVPPDKLLKGVTAPTGTTTTDGAPAPTGGTDISQQLSNIVQTGSAAPQPVADTAGPQATLVNPDTGERRAVSVGSQDAQALFGQGFVLEGAGGQPAGVQAPGTSTQASGTESAATGGANLESTIQQSPQGPDRISFLQGEANRVRSEAFNAVYGYTPDDWQDLPPGTQRFLRNQRVQNLARQLGNFNSAIQTVKEEMKTTRETALENLNLAMQFGVVDQMDDATLATLQQQTGLSADVIRSFGSQEEPPELRSVGGNLYAIQYNPETGAFESQLVIGGGGGTGGGGGGRTGGGIAAGTATAGEPNAIEMGIYNDVISGGTKISSLSEKEKAAFSKVDSWLQAGTTTETTPLGAFGERQIAPGTSLQDGLTAGAGFIVPGAVTVTTTPSLPGLTTGAASNEDII